MTENERIAKAEQAIHDHLIACNAAGERNEAAHTRICVVLARFDKRLWGIVLLLVAGLGAEVARALL